MYEVYIKTELLLNIRTRSHEVKWKYVEFAVSLKVAAMTDFLPKPRARGGGRKRGLRGGKEERVRRGGGWRQVPVAGTSVEVKRRFSKRKIVR